MDCTMKWGTDDRPEQNIGVSVRHLLYSTFIYI